MKRSILPVVVLTGLTLLSRAQEEETASSWSRENTGAMSAYNPAVSAIVDMFYYNENSEEGMGHIKGELPGFASHAHDDEEHEHGEVENGFNLREVELAFSAEVDGYFKALAMIAVSEEGAEVEEAWGETTALPWGFKVKAGKIYSDFGYINKQHPHQWDFTDAPLVYELTLGDHGLNEVGGQVSWLAPTPLYLLFGAEVLQGENEGMFAQEEADELPDNAGPRLGVGWVKFAPLRMEKHELQLGLFGANGNHQEIHDEGDGGTSTNNFFDGTSWFAGCDAVYKYDSGKAYGKGDAVLQAEYFYRNKDLDLVAADAGGGTVGEKMTSDQDGYYVQGTYGIFPRWRGGLRWEQVGLTNEESEGGTVEEFGDSWRASAMVDFRPSEFSQIRFQVNNGEYDLGDEGVENVLEAFVQFTVSLGAHGAHSF